MINSILDNDLYKFSMGNVVNRLFPDVTVKYEFINRGQHKFPPGFDAILIDYINQLHMIRLSDDEKMYLRRTCHYLDPAYIDFIGGYRFNPSEVEINQDSGDLSISIMGPWYRAIYWEVPLMATISELYFRQTAQGTMSMTEQMELLEQKKLKIMAIGAKIADFGTRRRFSYQNHYLVVRTLRDVLVGTSNVLLAKELGLRPIGTMAHELFMTMAALFGYRLANQITMEKWVEIFRGNLGIALSDTFTTDAFLHSFDMKFAKLFDGVRQDSGDPIEQACKIVKHYKSLGIDPATKTIVFSDSLDLDKVEKIHKYFDGTIKDSYGIGTYLTNDIGVKPLNMVIKITAVQGHNGNWIPAVKLSDEPGKHTGDPDEIAVCKRMLGVK